MNVVRIGNAQGFWGDATNAAATLTATAPDLQWITLDYLAELSMSILARQRQRDPSLGYARDFLDVVRSLIPSWRDGRKLRIVTNAGGLNPRQCAIASRAMLREAGCGHLKLSVVSGDDVLPQIMAGGAFAHLETDAPIDSVRDRLVTASAYLGAAPIVEAIHLGADLIITGRVADPSLTVAPAIAAFGWQPDDFDRIAGATVAGHLIECGAQVTGGISTEWLKIPDPARIGFPIAEISEDGSCIITKPAGSGGRVDFLTVKEQLLYEIGDPANYLSPDATVSFLTLAVEDLGNDRVRVSGATGGPPPRRYKVSATYRAGYRAAGTLTIFGRDAVAKARRCGTIVLDRLRDVGCAPARSRVECLGSGDAVPIGPWEHDAMETVLRIAVADPNRQTVEHFCREMSPLITAGPPGVCGYGEGRPAAHEVFGYWPTLIDRSAVQPIVEMIV
jgi:hypothetical protein